MNEAMTWMSPGPAHDCWIPTLQLATQEVFQLMLGYSLESLSEPPAEDNLDMTAMVGLAGRLCGVLTLQCSAKSAAHMASRMLGIDPEKAGPEMWDAAGEICNMVAGNFKNKINGLGDGCMLSVPTVITGSDYNIRSMVNDSLKATFLFEGEPVIISIEVHS